MNIGTRRLYPEGMPVGATTERRCPNCRTWHLANGGCPDCGYEPRFNKRLRTAMLNAHLEQQRG